MSEKWKTATGMTREEFEKITLYLSGSEFESDSRNRAIVLGFVEERIRVSPCAIVRLREKGRIGKGSLIGLFAYVNGEVIIGEDVLIGPHCSISAGNHGFNVEGQNFKARAKNKESNRIVIGDGCWLAAGCMVTAGVRMGRCNLICANSVLTRSTDDYSIMAGTPARKVGEINPATGEYVWYGDEDGGSDGDGG